ncbi:MAG TPA: hypothetical protein VNZ67_14325 [bacterium]|nr:hypothetical protein [bacterium]
MARIVFLMILSSSAAAFSTTPSDSSTRFNLANSSPFLKHDAKADQLIRTDLLRARITKPYSIVLDKYFSLTSNVEKKDVSTLQKAVSSISTELNPKLTSYWKVNLGKDGEPSLLVTYDNPEALTPPVEKPDFSYNYLNLWLFQWQDGRYQIYYIGPFLQGTVHEPKVIGALENKSIVVEHVSCMECEPWVYLTFAYPNRSKMDFSPFLFSYSKDKQDGDINLEYDLPGMGSSIDANVETRIPSDKSESAPTIIQNFRMIDCGEKRKDEWWVFRCKDFKCKPEVYDLLPPSVERYWKNSFRYPFEKHQCE